MRSKQSERIIIILFLLLASSILFVTRFFWIGLPYNSEGFGPFGNAIFAFFLTCYVLLISGSLGLKVLAKWFQFQWTIIEKIFLSISLGLGILSLCIFGLGLLGFIQSYHFISLLFIIGCISINEIQSVLRCIFPTIHLALNTLNQIRPAYRTLFYLGLFSILLTFIQTLPPPTDYDGLMYHLQGPRLFLDAGRIYPNYDNWFTLYPFSWEMLYMLGLGLGSDIFAKMVHFSTFLLILLATYSFGTRFLPKPGGWLSAAILMGNPVMLLWSPHAYTDLSIALFQFSAIGLFLLWVNERNKCLIILSGLMQGFAIGNKYLAFSGAIIVGCCILFFSWKDNHPSEKWRTSIKNGVIFAIAALLPAAPWLIKNLVWTGNPIFPFLFSANGLDPLQVELWYTYVGSFGVGKEWFDYLLLPIRLFSHLRQFGTWYGLVGPHPIFLLAFTYPIVRKHFGFSIQKPLDVLIWIILFQFVFWATGSQQTRFLFPAYPGLCIISSAILIYVSESFKRNHLGSKIIYITVAASVISTMVVVMSATIAYNPVNLFRKSETKEDFLEKFSKDYTALKFIKNTLPKSAKVLMLYDGRGYYCDQHCLPDIDQARWTTMVQRAPTISVMKDLITENKISHLLYSKEDEYFFLTEHDPTGKVRIASDFFHKFKQDCAREVFRDSQGFVFIYELAFDKGQCK